MGTNDVHQEESYFSKHPNIEPSDSPPRQIRPRPPTPPFPTSKDVPPSTTSISPRRTTGSPKTHSKRKSESRQSYAQLLTWLRDEDREEHHPRAHSRSHSRASSNDALLHLLSLETARADAAERQLAQENEAVLLRVRNIRDAHARSEAELLRVNAELALYKFQLDMAQKEILRAQSIVNEVERARAEAEEQGMKDREKVRKMVLERAIEDAREEGRQEGWRLGLERGRWDVRARQAEDRNRLLNTVQEANNETSVEVQSSARARSQTIESQPSTSSRWGTQSTRSTSAKISPPAARGASLSSRTVDTTGSEPRARSPETRPPSLAPSRRSVRSIPLEGFIPTLGSDEHIALPPPHELSAPVNLVDPVGAPHPTSAAGPRHDKCKEAEHAHDGDSARPRPERQVHLPVPIPTNNSRPRHDASSSQAKRGDGQDTPPLATASKRSTTISEFDIIKPPPSNRLNSERPEPPATSQSNRRQIEFYATPMASREQSHFRELTSSEKIAQDGRTANPNHKVASPPDQSQSNRQIGFYALPATAQDESRSRELTSSERIAQDGRSTQSGWDHDALEIRSPKMRSPRITGGPSPPDTSASQAVKLELPRRGSYLYSSSETDQSIATPRSSVANLYGAVPPGSGENYQQGSRRTVQRSTSNVTVPGIDVEPPSPSLTDSSPGTVIDPILLTPQHANHILRPPDPVEPRYERPDTTSFSSAQPIIVNELPPGFVSLTPIPAINDLHPDDSHHLNSHRAPHQIYAASSKPLGEPSSTTSTSILSSDKSRSSTSAPSDSVSQEHALDYSPAPLDRPFSIFSDD